MDDKIVINIGIKESLQNSTRLAREFGNQKIRQQAVNIYQRIICSAYDASNEGYDHVTFDEEDLPEECVPYFEHLAKEEGLTFNKKVIDLSDIDEENEMLYELSWEEE